MPTRDQWKVIQNNLKSLGLYKGLVDGLNGPLTTAAIRAFQTMHGLSVDGIYGPKTAAALFPPLIPDRTVHVTDVVPKTNLWPRSDETSMTTFYGLMGKHMASLSLPYEMRLAWDLDTIVKHITIHEKLIDSATRCFARILDAYPTAASRALIGIDLFGGSLAVRKMRGGTKFSVHSWGAAIDFDPARNQLTWGRDRARLAKPDADAFWKIWEEEGWVSLGRTKDYDWMHIQAARS